MKPKLLWHSNAPWTPTGYGQQTKLFAPLLGETYDVAVSAFYGLEGAPIRYGDIPVLPGLGGEFGNDTLPQHAARFFGGDPRGGLTVTLCDVWPLRPESLGTLKLVCWTPVDHEPAPAKIVEFLANSGAVPVAMSRFGESMLGMLDPLYCPHAVDTEIFRPMDRAAARQGFFPGDAFVVGMNGANKGHPSRKAFPQALQAFAEFARNHDDAFLYLHTVLDSNYAQGVNLMALLRDLGIPPDRTRIADPYTISYNPYSWEGLARIYGVMDVLLNPSFGEGFGIPVLEAQACAVPAIVADSTAMREVCGAGWHVATHPYWTALNSWQGIPKIDEIVWALEQCYAMPEVDRSLLALKAREHAIGYDARRVLKQFMLPALRAAAQRHEADRIVRIPSRIKRAA